MPCALIGLVSVIVAQSEYRKGSRSRGTRRKGYAVLCSSIGFVLGVGIIAASVYGAIKTWPSILEKGSELRLRFQCWYKRILKYRDLRTLYYCGKYWATTRKPRSWPTTEYKTFPTRPITVEEVETEKTIAPTLRTEPPTQQTTKRRLRTEPRTQQTTQWRLRTEPPTQQTTERRLQITTQKPQPTRREQETTTTSQPTLGTTNQ